MVSNEDVWLDVYHGRHVWPVRLRRLPEELLQRWLRLKDQAVGVGLIEVMLTVANIVTALVYDGVLILL